jgi:hypothetical protein
LTFTNGALKLKSCHYMSLLGLSHRLARPAVRHKCAIGERMRAPGLCIFPDQRGGDDGTRTHDPLLANTPERDDGER